MVASELDFRAKVDLLYRDHHGWLRGWLRKRLGNGFDAADLAHDTYVKLIARGQAPERDESRRHLVQVAKGLMIDLYRRRQIEATYLEALASVPQACVPSEEQRALAIEALVEIDALLHGLPRNVRSALLLCRLEGMSYRDIAERLQVSVSSVEKYIASGLQACYRALYEG